MDRMNAILQQRGVMVFLVLNDGSERKNSFIVSLIVRQSVAKVRKRQIVIVDPDVEKTDRCQQLTALREVFEARAIDLQGLAFVSGERVDPAELKVALLTPVQFICAHEALDGILIVARVPMAHALVVMDLPIVRAKLLAVDKQVDRVLVAAKQVQGASELLEVFGIRRIQHVAAFEYFERLIDLVF